MITNEDRDRIAARAAGEDLPGTDGAELDRLLADSREARSDLAELEEIVRTLRAAGEVPPPLRRRSGRLLGLLGAGIAVAATVLLVLHLATSPEPSIRSRVPPPASPVEAGPRPFAGFPPATRGPRIGSDALVPAGGVTMGGPRAAPRPGPAPRPRGRTGGPETRYLAPFSKQAGFRIATPILLPRGFVFGEARLLRGPPSALVRLLYRGKEGPIVLVEAAEGSGREVGEFVPPRGWLAVDRTVGGARVLAASPVLTEEALRRLFP